MTSPPSTTGTSQPGERSALGPLAPLIRSPAAGGAALGIATIVALVWANVAPDAYTDFWSTKIDLSLGSEYDLEVKLSTIIKNAVMSVFFLVVGLEIKRELTVGELADRRIAILPFFAAAGGMLVPVGVFLAITAGTAGAAGWGIPMATDIAFALAALRLLGGRVPVQLIALMLAIAVIDDIGAILVIAVAYSDALAIGWLAASLGALALVAVLLRLRVTALTPHVTLFLIAWACMAQSGVSPTIAAVAFGLLMPATVIAARHGRHHGDHGEGHGHDPRIEAMDAARAKVPILHRMEHSLAPWSSFVVLPLFALAFAGIRIDADTVQAALESRVTFGVALGLIVGKTVGVTLGALLALRLGIGRLPPRVNMVHVVGVGALAGIGFTVSLFVATLAYSDPGLVDEARMGILAGSVIAAVVGLGALLMTARRDGGEVARTAGDVPEHEAGEARSR